MFCLHDGRCSSAEDAGMDVAADVRSDVVEVGDVGQPDLGTCATVNLTAERSTPQCHAFGRPLV